jgi:hypothetical protein
MAVDHQPVAIVAPHDRHDRPVVGDDHRDPLGARRDGDPEVAGLDGLSLAEVPGHPPTALADRPPPGEGKLDMFTGDGALRAATPGVRA